MHLILLLLLPLLSLGVEMELNIDPGDGTSIALSAFYSHEKFYTELVNQIGLKVKNATLATLAHRNQNIDILLAQMNDLEYTFLQMFHSLATGDVFFTNQLIELYNNSGSQLQLSDYFKSQIMLGPEPSYWALNSIANSPRNGLKPIQDNIINAILTLVMKPYVFNEASRRGNILVMKMLLPLMSDDERFSAFENAWYNNRFDIVKIIIKNNISFVKPGIISLVNKKGENILHLAVELKNHQLLEYFLQNGGEINTSDENGATPLLKAAKNNDITSVKMLIDKKADVNTASKSGVTPLYEAVRNGNYEMAILLLSSGSSVTKETEEGVTPLLIAEKHTFIGIIDYLFWNNYATVKQLHKDRKFFYLMSSYEGANRTARRRRISLNRILDQSKIAKELYLRGERTYIPNDIKSMLSYSVIELGITPLAQAMFNIGFRFDPKDHLIKTLFRDLIKNNNHELVALLLSEGMSPNTEIASTSSLQIAADTGSETTFNLLLKKGADISKTTNYIGSMLHAASEGGRTSIVRQLLNNGSNVNSVDPDGNTPLFIAAIFGNSETVKLLLEHKADIHMKNKDKDSVLHLAVYGNDEKTVNTLIENGAKIQERNKYGETPLFICAKEGNVASLKILLKAGAETEVKENNNQTPLQISILRRHLNTTRILLENGANPNVVDNEQRTCLHLAVSTGDVEFVKLLLEKGVLTNMADINGRTALHEAVSKKSLSMVQLLVKSGVLLNVKDKDTRTPLDDAITSCSRDIVSYLVKKGAKATIKADPNCIIGSNIN